MANEIDFQVSLQLRNGNLQGDFKPGNVDIDQASAEAQKYVVTITSSAQITLSTSGVTTEGLMMMRNLSGSNYFDFGPSTTGGSTGIMFGRCKAGEPAAFRLKPGVIPLAIAQSTAASGVDALIEIWND